MKQGTPELIAVNNYHSNSVYACINIFVLK